MANMDINTRIDHLNEIIIKLRNAEQYTAHRDEMNILLRQIQAHHTEENHVQHLDPRLQHLYLIELQRPRLGNITLEKQIPIVRILWVILQQTDPENYMVDSDNSQDSGDNHDYVPPADFFTGPGMAAQGLNRSKSNKKKRSRKCRKGRKGKKCRKSRRR